MTQLTPGLPLGGADANLSGLRDDTGSEMLPSAGETSGLPPAVRQRLVAAVREAGGDVGPIVQQLRARIAEIDSRPLPEEGPQHHQLQADRALLVAQASYLEDQVAAGRTWEEDEYAGTSGNWGSSDRGQDDWEDSSKIGTGGGGLAGAATGAAIGSVGGPVGTVIGGVAGAATGAGIGAAGDVAGERAEDRRRVRVYDSGGATLSDRAVASTSSTSYGDTGMRSSTGEGLIEQTGGDLKASAERATGLDLDRSGSTGDRDRRDNF